MAEVAAEAGVSKMTVSLALRSSSRISEATRKRILEVAERMNYRPNPLVQTLMANLKATRTLDVHSTMAWVTAFDTVDGWQKHWVHKMYFEGAVRRGKELGYKIEPIWAFSKGMRGARLSNVLRARGIRGLVVPPVGNPQVRLDIDWQHFSCATIGYSFMEPRLYRSAANLHDAMSLALSECEKRGYRRIGFVTPSDTDERVNHSWMATYLVWQRFKPKREVLPMLYVEQNIPIEDVLEAWVKKYRPDVIISPNFEFIFWLPQMGLRVPEDIGVVSLATPTDNEYKDLIAGIDQNHRVVGEAAVDLVVSQLQKNEMGLPEHPKIMLTEGEWVDGPSLLDSADALNGAMKEP